MAAPADAATVAAAAPTTQLWLVDPASYIGQNVDVAHAYLSAMGFTPVDQLVPTRDAPAGTVLDLTPSGQLAPGTTITISVAQDPGPEAPAAGKDGKGHKKGGH